MRVYQDLAFDYDAHGNVTQRIRGNQAAGTHSDASFTWNADHQLAQATVSRHGVTQTTRYAYDALGRRVTKADSFGATHYLWDGDLMVHSQRGSKEALFVFEPNSFVPLATVQGAANDATSQQTYWYQCDQIGVPQELTDAQGNIVWAADYKVWGEAKVRQLTLPQSYRTGTDDYSANDFTPKRGGTWKLAGSNSTNSSSNSSSKAVAANQFIQIEQPFRFQGQQFDEETGLHYNRFRYYDPVIGRFVSQDPIGLEGGDHNYLYGSNSMSWIDPLGLKKAPSGAPQHSSRTSVQPVNGRMPINNCFAGKTMVGESLPESVRGKYPHGVPFNMQGFPDFSRYAKKTVNIEMGNSRGVDFGRANSAAFGKGNPYGSSSPTINGTRYTWHHNQESGKMQLIPEDIHDAVKHTGGVATKCPK